MGLSRQRKTVLLAIGLIGVPAACYALMVGLIRMLVALSQCSLAPGMQNCADSDAPFYFWITAVILLAAAAAGITVAAIPSPVRVKTRVRRIRRRRALKITRHNRYPRPIVQR